MMQQTPRETGWIEVICGSMFSGKTEELIRRMRRAEIAKQNIVLFKPRIDDRYATDFVISHDKRVIEAVSVDDANQIELLAKNYDVVGIDEVQFFGPEIVDVCESLAGNGKRVIVSGLDQDYLGNPFDPMPTLLSVGEYITKELAICMICGNPADRTQRIIDEEERVVIGGNEFYEARCRKCFKPGILTKSDIEEDY